MKKNASGNHRQTLRHSTSDVLVHLTTNPRLEDLTAPMALTAAQLTGWDCISCGTTQAPQEQFSLAGWVDGHGQVFACAKHRRVDLINGLAQFVWRDGEQLLQWTHQGHVFEWDAVERAQIEQFIDGMRSHGEVVR